MGDFSYKSPGWDTHRESKLREIDFPLFEGSPDHFTILRTYSGPLDTYVKHPLDAVDATFDGVAKNVTGTAADDRLVTTAAHNLTTGDPVTLTITTGLAPLVTATVYYVIRISSTIVKLASSQAGAVAGGAMNITSDGTGTLTAAKAYLVRQSGLRAIDADAVSYERLFSTVPAAWSEPESFAFTFPGFVTSITGSAYSITDLTINGSLTVITTPATGIAANDAVYISVKYTRGGFVYNTTFFTKVISVNAGVTVHVGLVFSGTGTFSAITGTIRKGAIGRLTEDTLIAGGRLLHDYALSSIAALDTDLPILQAFSPSDSTGNKVTLLSTGSATVPNSADYAALITGGGELVVGCERKRYLGNIYVRITRLVPAL